MRGTSANSAIQFPKGGEGIGVSPNGTVFTYVAPILPDTALGHGCHIKKHPLRENYQTVFAQCTIQRRLMQHFSGIL